MTHLLNTHKASLFVKHLSISDATIIDFGGTEGKSLEHSRSLCWLLFPFAAFITEIKALSFCPCFLPPQVVPDRAAPPPGQFRGQAFGADAPSVVL